MRIAVIGTGYVGLVTGTCFSETGNHVICVDNNQEKLRQLTSGVIPIYEPGLEVLFHRNIEKQRITFTDNLGHAVGSSEVVFLCLPTPEGDDGSADLTYVLAAAAEIGRTLKSNSNKEYRIIVNKSTVPVGTAGKISAILKSEGAANFDVVSNPEFLREGFAVEDFMKPERIVIGSDSPVALRKLHSLYESFVRQGNPIIEMDVLSAEVTKYASNSYLAMRITYVNEVANYCEAVGADVEMVRRGMGSDSRIGKRFLFPGIGYGGSCFPKDVKALIKSSVDAGAELKILKVVDEVNETQKLVLVGKVLRHFGGSVRGRKLAVWGLSFKPNTDDMREAPSLVIINRLCEEGALITAYDPASTAIARKLLKDRIRYAQDSMEALDGSEALLVLTEWSEFRTPDLEQMKNRMASPVIFDGRNIFEPKTMSENGFVYHGIGRSRS
ncbi:MAG TPA: UDP-glucose/GDP-mannose dehydrogenase family protein [Bacteroidota bacterium]|nr:UDP-glucose/GDP-mannose dehydrogenase family protein [Bacteroidota bacterium]